MKTLGSLLSSGSFWKACIFESSLRPLFMGWNWERETQKMQENQLEMQVGTSGTLDEDWSSEDEEKQLDSNLV